MKAVLVIAALLVCTTLAADRKAMFASFKQTFGKQYASEAEEATRFQHFSRNMDSADIMNAKNPLATFGINQFSDQSAEEFKVMHSGDEYFKNMQHRQAKFAGPEYMPKAGSSIDWRTKGAVTPVKNQGQCGSCWSFSATGNIEGQWAIAGNSLTSLSEQELVSCDTTDNACKGGLMDNAFNWLVNNQGGNIDTDASYPYVSGQGQVPACKQSNQPAGATITGHHDIPHDETSMASYCYANGPVSIGVDATSWQTYTGGIMTNCISKQVDHGVLIVGFDDTNSPPYWIIKNSWTATWGEQGYIRVQKGTDQCLLTSAPSSSLVGSGPRPPTPPAPPVNPTPAPYSPPSPPSPPSGKKYTYYNCRDSGCTDCKEYTFADAACIDEESLDTSFEAECYDYGFHVAIKTFADSAKCSGTGSVQKVSSGTCYENEVSGTYIKFKCPW